MTFRLTEGSPARLGLRLDATGANIAVLSRHATRVELCLFDPDGREAARLPLPGRTGDVRHGRLEGMRAGDLYALRAHGPWAPEAGHRFNPAKLLLDPWALGFTEEPRWSEVLRAASPEAPSAPDPRDSAPFMPRCVAMEEPPRVDPAERPRTPWSRTLIYEAHARGLTRLDPDMPEALRGSYEALGHPATIARLKRLGVTALQILPIHAMMDERHLVARGLKNYWGYNSFGFFAASPRHAGPGAAPEGSWGLRRAISSLHAAGIEVILDVVFNHSAESDAGGPVLHFRGLDDAEWYRHAPAGPEAPGGYVNDTGCGDTLDFGKPFARRLARESLRWWVERMGVDGFRFDLAPVLGRGPDGSFESGRDFLEALRDDPVLADVKLIAEPWDIGPGGHRTGQFPPGWAEWNDGFRDAARAFWMGRDRGAQDLASGLLGSSEAFETEGRAAWGSVNYVAAHDGFTLADQTLYAERRNQANGEDNRDGHAGELSDPMGPEGPGDPAQEAARARRRRNLLLTVMVSQGTPMLRAGDEIAQSQGGNNNAYCQDNETTWVDWAAGDAALAGFCAAAAALRARLPVLRQGPFLHGAQRGDGQAEASWHGLSGGAPDWDAPDLPGYVLVLRGAAGLPEGTPDPTPVALVLNAGDEAQALNLPDAGPGLAWACALTTETEDGRPPDPTPADPTPPAEIPPACALVFEAVPAAPALTRLGRRMGLVERYYEVTGKEHFLSDPTRRALLRAMGVLSASDPAEAEAEAARVLARMEAEPPRRLPPEIVAEADRPGSLVVPEGLGWVLHLEDGEVLKGGAGEAPPALPMGLHRLEAGGESALVAAAPAQAPSVPAASGAEKVWGLTGAAYALCGPRSLGEGDFADLAQAAESAAPLGAAFLGVNPVHAMGAAYPGISPYSPSSRTALDHHRVAPERIEEFARSPKAQAILEAAQPDLAAWRADAQDQDPDQGLTDPGLSRRLRGEIMRAVFATFREEGRAGSPRQAAFDFWLETGGLARRRFALFEALSLALGGDDWRRWPAEYQDPASAEVASFAAGQGEEIAFHAWCQWQAEQQLAEAQERALAAGMRLGLYLDIAVGVRPGGAETWARPGAFARGVSMGAPPDALSAQGQSWGLAPFAPQGLRDLAYAPFREMLRAAMHFAGAARIDHVIGLERGFWQPEAGAEESAETDVPGGYVSFPAEMLLALTRIEAHRAGCVVVGEDLGTVPEGLRARLADSGLHGCAIMQFEGGADGFRPPADYPRRSLAAFGTHDTPTLAGWWQGADADLRLSLGHLTPQEAAETRALRARERQALARLLAEAGVLPEGLDPEAPPETLTPALGDAIHVALAQGASALCAVQIDDAFARLSPQNVPGTVSEAPNWRRLHPVAPESLGEAEALIRLAERLRQARPG